MNFVKQIIDIGFIEQGQKRIVDRQPHKANLVPNWWENYPYNTNWFGLSVTQPDAWFRKPNFDGELMISLQGCIMPLPLSVQDEILCQNRAVKYICLKIGKEKIFETFSGEIPSKEVLEMFIKEYN
jgi:hypothetical protein